MLLTIAIPTYAREKKLTSLLESLIPECSANNVEILVVDNASPVDVETYVRANIREIPAFVRFHRNRANIGLAANICRCHELADSEWVWTLGDDDTLPHDALHAVLHILGDITPADHTAAIQFSTTLHHYSQQQQINNLEDFWNIHSNHLAFSNAVFLSSCVFRSRVFIDYMRTAYQFCFSIAPHVAVKIAALRDGHTITIHPLMVMQHMAPEPGEGWDWTTLSACLPTLAEIPGDNVSIRKLGIPLSRIIPGLRLRKGIGMIFLHPNRCAGFWHAYYSRLVPLLRGRWLANGLFLRMVAGLSFHFPLLGRFGRRLFIAAGKSLSHDSGNIDRL